MRPYSPPAGTPPEGETMANWSDADLAKVGAAEELDR